MITPLRIFLLSTEINTSMRNSNIYKKKYYEDSSNRSRGGASLYFVISLTNCFNSFESTYFFPC